MARRNRQAISVNKIILVGYLANLGARIKIPLLAILTALSKASLACLPPSLTPSNIVLNAMLESSFCAGFKVPAPKYLATLSGTEEEKMIYLANKDLPTGTKYEIVADDYVPSDRTFRNAWEYETGSNEKISADLTADELTKYNRTKQYGEE